MQNVIFFGHSKVNEFYKAIDLFKKGDRGVEVIEVIAESANKFDLFSLTDFEEMRLKRKDIEWGRNNLHFNKEGKIVHVDYGDVTEYHVWHGYGSAQARILAKGHEIINSMLDVRKDGGDDGGYLVAVTSKKGKFYLIVADCNYNYDIDSDYLMIYEFKTLDDCYKKASWLADEALNLMDSDTDDYYMYDPQDIEDKYGEDTIDCKSMDAIMQALQDYPEYDYPSLKRLDLVGKNINLMVLKDLEEGVGDSYEVDDEGRPAVDYLLPIK